MAPQEGLILNDLLDLEKSRRLLLINADRR